MGRAKGSCQPGNLEGHSGARKDYLSGVSRAVPSSDDALSAKEEQRPVARPPRTAIPPRHLGYPKLSGCSSIPLGSVAPRLDHEPVRHGCDTSQATLLGVCGEVPPLSPSSGPAETPIASGQHSKATPMHDGVPDSPFDGVPGFCSEFTFWSWAASLPRLVLASGTAYARFLRVSFCIRSRGSSAPSSALFPLPIPDLQAFAASGPQSKGVSGEPSQALKRKLVARVLHIVAMSLNFLHSDLKQIPDSSLRRSPNESHERIFSRLEGMIWACSARGSHPLSSGRRGPHLVARLRELCSHLQELGLSTFPYPRSDNIKSFVPHCQEGPESLRPYREADPERLKISGDGSWPLVDFLGPELKMPYKEPKILRSIPPNDLPFPDALGEDRARSLGILKLWDARGLLFLAFEPKQPRELTRVFAAYKNETSDRQIGDRRGANGLEGRVVGPSTTLPPGQLLTALTVPRGSRLIGASTDRADFYHQSMISSARAESNAIGPRFKIKDLEGTATLAAARAAATHALQEGGEDGRLAIKAAGLCSADVPPSLLFDSATPVFGAFRSLYQGDHIGVEFSTEAHAALLQGADLLSSRNRLLARHPPARTGPWEALVIDDYFVLSVEDKTCAASQAESTRRVLRAKARYEQARVQGSDHKDVLGSDCITAAGAQIDSSPLALESGGVFVSAPTGKLLALAVISLKTSALPAVSEELASNLAGSWIAVLMFRRCLFSALDGFFALGKSGPSPASGSLLRPLSRKVAQELVLLATLVPVMSSNVSAGFHHTLFCSDASTKKGAFCCLGQREEVVAAVWLSADRKGHYTRLDPTSPAADVASSDELDQEPAPEGISKPLAFDFDVLCLLGGSDCIARACKDKGLRVSPVLDLRYSSEYDVTGRDLAEWAIHLIWSGRARSLVAVLPSGHLSGVQPANRRHLKGRKKTRDRLAERILGLLKIAVRARCPALVLYSAGSGFLSLPAASGLLKSEGVTLLPPAPAVDCCEEGPVTFPGVLFSSTPLPAEFMRSRQVPGAALSGLAQCLWQLLGAKSKEEQQRPGLENLVVNDLLFSGAWCHGLAWRWDRPRHINALETEAAVAVLRHLVRGGETCRPVVILDSACARGALAKGRSSTRLLRPSLRRAAALSVGGGIYPAYVFGPTRLNVADDPSRDVQIRPPASHSVLHGLSEETVVRLCGLAGSSKVKAGWLRLSLLVSAPEDRQQLVQAVVDLPFRACPPSPPASLFGCALPGDHPAEVYSRAMLASQRFELFVLGELLNLLPQAGKKRFGLEGEEKFWTTGLYSQGPFRGVRKASLKFPWSTQLACRVVRQAAPEHCFTSVALLQDVRSAPHKDKNNAPGVPSLVCALSHFEGGQIWIEGGQEDTPETFDGVQKYGELLDPRTAPVYLDGHRTHLTCEWKGTRQIAVAFCIRDAEGVPTPAWEVVRKLGFHLPRRRSRPPRARSSFHGLDFDATLGYPGEGPFHLLLALLVCFLCGLSSSAFLGPRNAADRARAERRSPLGLPAGRAVLPRTGSNRADLAAAFSQWLLDVSGTDLQSLLERKPFDAEEVAEALVRYGRDLYGSGRPYWHFAETINAVTSAKPILRRQVQAAWDLSFAWLAEEPYNHHTAIPPPVLIAVLTACLLWGWTREAGCFALAFGGIMRIGEVLKTSRKLLVLPEDVAYSQSFVLVRIEEPKTRGRCAKHQAAKIEAEDLVQVIILAFSPLHPLEMLWPMSPQTLRKRFDVLLKRVGASPPPVNVRALDLGSFRPGGATYMLQQTEDSELCRCRGRWASARVMEIYLQEIAAATFLPLLPKIQKDRIFVFAAGFVSVLEQAQQWKQAGIKQNVWFRLWPGG